MPMLDIHVDGDACWPDLDLATVLHGELTGIAALPGGMASGRLSVTLRLQLDDGQVVLAETSMRLLGMAVDAFRERYGREP